MTIFSAAASTDALDCKVYIIQEEKSLIKISLNNQGVLNYMGLIEATSKILDEQITFVSTVNEFTLMPNLSIEQLPENIIPSFLKWTNSDTSNIVKNPLLFDNISILFNFPTEQITKRFPAAKFTHGIEFLVNQSMLSTKDESITALVLEKQLLLSVIKNGHLQLSNIFQVENNEEVIYYIMLMFQELDLTAENVILQIYGECEEQPFLEQHLSKFIRNTTSNIHPSISNMKYSGIAKFIEIIQ